MEIKKVKIKHCPQHLNGITGFHLGYAFLDAEKELIKCGQNQGKIQRILENFYEETRCRCNEEKKGGPIAELIRMAAAAEQQISEIENNLWRINKWLYAGGLSEFEGAGNNERSTIVKIREKNVNGNY